MADVIGTTGNDTLTGTDSDDTIRPNGGVDSVDGGTGSDTLIVDYGLVINAQSRWFLTATNATGTSGTIGQDTAIFNHHDLITFSNIENINLSAAGWVIVDGRLMTGAGSLTLNGNGVGDHLELSLRTFTTAINFTINGTNAAITSGTFTNFEQYTVYFGSGADTANGGSNADVFFGLNGNDTLNGNDGADSLWGGDGTDIISGGDGDDYAYGGAGVDNVRGGAGNDILYGHDGVSPDNNTSADTVDGGDGNDKVVGGYGDTLIGGAGYDILTLDLSQGTVGVVIDLGAMFAGGSAANGTGTISGFEAWHTIAGTSGNDTITIGNGLFDPNGERAYSAFLGAISGLGGADIISGGLSADLVFGGEGNDTINGGDGNDNLQGENGDDTIRGDAGDDQIQGGAGLNMLYGGIGNDRIDGGANADQLYGEDGDDIVQGNGGGDLLDGGAGNDQIFGGGFSSVDTMRGGAGDDIYFNVDGSDTVTENANEGIDTVVAGSGTVTLGANLEILDLRGLGTFSGTGNGLNNILMGGFNGGTLSGLGGDDTLEGGSGADTLIGGLGIDLMTGKQGNDSYHVDQQGDVVIENAGEGTDTVVSTVGYELLQNIENLTLAAGAGSISGVGNDLANVIIGNEGSNRLTGGLGNDSLDGGSSVDTAVVLGNRSAYTVTQTSTGNFTVVGPDGTDTLVNIEYLQFSDQTLRLLPGTGTTVDFNASPASYMGSIRDFGGNDLGGAGGWSHIGTADVDGDGDIDHILVNQTIGRFAEVATAPDGLVYFSDHSWAGETRVVGIYIDPLVQANPALSGGPFDSQARFQNDLLIGNINGVLGGGDYDHDGLQEVYFRLTDGTAYLHAYMHADGNIRYANYQNQQQVIDFLTTNGWAPSTYAGWFPAAAEALEFEFKDDGPVAASLAGAGQGEHFAFQAAVSLPKAYATFEETQPDQGMLDQFVFGGNETGVTMSTLTAADFIFG